MQLDDSGRGRELKQTPTLRRAGVARALILLENTQWKVREDILQVDGITVASEKQLFRHIIKEALAGVGLLYASDQCRTIRS